MAGAGARSAKSCAHAQLDDIDAGLRAADRIVERPWEPAPRLGVVITAGLRAGGRAARDAKGDEPRVGIGLRSAKFNAPPRRPRHYCRRQVDVERVAADG